MKKNSVETRDEGTFSLSEKVPSSFPIDKERLESMKETVLGKDYKLSVVICDKELSQKLNREYRKKDKPTNILSFPLEENSGEIFICSLIVEEEASDFDRSPEKFLEFLFIHGITHLNGYEHGSKMEEEERKIRLQYEV